MIKIIFPSNDSDNLVYRNGFIRLSAFASEWDAEAQEDIAAQISERLKVTARKKYNIFVKERGK